MVVYQLSLINCYIVYPLQKSDSSVKQSLVESAVLAALQPDSKLDDFQDIFRNSRFNCSSKLSSDRKEFVVFRSAIDLTKLNMPRTTVLNSLVDWIISKPNIKSEDNIYQLNILLVTTCETSVLFLDSPLCDYNGVMVGDTGGLSTPVAPLVDNGAAGGLGAVLAISIIVNIVIVIILGAVGVYFWKKKRCYKPRTVG